VIDTRVPLKKLSGKEVKFIIVLSHGSLRQSDCLLSKKRLCKKLLRSNNEYLILKYGGYRDKLSK
jgi:hypothetical protein